MIPNEWQVGRRRPGAGAGHKVSGRSWERLMQPRASGASNERYSPCKSGTAHAGVY